MMVYFIDIQYLLQKGYYFMNLKMAFTCFLTDSFYLVSSIAMAYPSAA